MRKLFIINDASGTAAQYGIGTFIQELTESPAVENCQVLIVDVNSVSSLIECEESKCATHFRIPRTKIRWDSDNYHYYRNIAYYLAASVSKEDEAVFHFNYLHHGTIASVLRELLPEARQILTFHYQEEELKDKGKSFFDTVDYVVTLCEDTYRMINDVYGIGASKLRLIVNGIKDRYRETENKQRISLRRKYGFTTEDKLILFVGRISEQKGIGVLLEAVKPLIEKDKNIHLLLVGSGDKARYQQSSIGYWKNVHWVGKQERSTVFELYQMADVGAFPSFQEQFGYAAIEMMMFGLPVVAYAESGGLKDIFQWDGICEYTVPTKDALGLSKKLESVLAQETKDTILFRECFLKHYQDDKLKAYHELYFTEKRKKGRMPIIV
ncbi:MAG: glycosyltransferase [Parabacteroides sp.]|nr:glycosyltransferase [Parabacteroides sp.]